MTVKTKSVIAGAAAALVTLTPVPAMAQDVGSLLRDVARTVEKVTEKEAPEARQGDEVAFPGDILDSDGDTYFPGDILDENGLTILPRSPLEGGVEHQMLVKIDSPVTRRGTYRVILREAGTRGRNGIRDTTYLSDTDLDEANTHVVVRLKAPDTPGRYQAQLTREDVNDVLASTPLDVALDSRPSISGLPERARRGERVAVGISGDRYYYNNVSFVQDRKTAKSMQYDRIITNEGEYLVMPRKAGTYDVVVTYGFADGQTRRQATVGRVTVK